MRVLMWEGVQGPPRSRKSGGARPMGGPTSANPAGARAPPAPAGFAPMLVCMYRAAPVLPIRGKFPFSWEILTLRGKKGK